MRNTDATFSQSRAGTSPAILNVRWHVYHVIRMLRWRVRAARGNWILGRHACLGADVRALIGGTTPILNLQKCRADYLLDSFASRTIRARTHRVDPYMRNREILPMVAAQEQPYWDFLGRPNAVFIDSFSELTDQLYSPRSGQWHFCANHSDLDHTGDFDERFQSHGLLPNDVLYRKYDELFSLFRDKFGDIPVLYLHFPSKLESREKFIARAASITDAVSRLSGKFKNLHIFQADQAIVDWPESDHSDIHNFPYHYNDLTYQAFYDQIRQRGIDRVFRTS